jgi:hypothetical protein
MNIIITSFNNQFLNLINDLIYVFPEDIDFLIFKKYITYLINSFPSKLFDIFNLYIIPYENIILQKDEQFFLDQNSFPENKIDNFNSIINKLKSSWNLLEINNKDKIWKYFKIFILLKRKFNE